MRAARTLALAMLSAAAAACTCSTAPGPRLVAVDPPEWPQGLDASLRIVGSGFAAEVRTDFDDPARSSVDGVFRATLVAGDVRVPLADVGLHSGEELRATLPAGAEPGTYDLEVVDPRGRLARLPSAFAVFEAECTGEGAPCDDGDLCTTGDTCLGWRCLPEAQVVCTALDQCHEAGACDSVTGLCSDPPAEDGKPCSVSGCPVGDTCQAGVCTPLAGACENTAPLARLSVSPGGGTAGVTSFTLDASGSSDAEDVAGSLRFRFDPDGDGVWDGGFSFAPFHDHLYSSSGVYTAAVEVQDSGGLSAYATALVVVAAAGDEVRVTTTIDELDPGATPEAPGGQGLSLREAVEWVNAQGRPKTITLDAATLGEPPTIAISGARGGLALLASDTTVVGDSGVTLDFGGLGDTCISLDRPGQRLMGVTMVGCTGVFVSMKGQGSQVAQVTVVGAGGPAIGIQALGDLAGPSPSSRIGPGNDLSGLATAVDLLGSDYEVFRNRLHGNRIGCEVNGDRARLLQNVFVRQVAVPSLPDTGVGLLVHTVPGPVEVRHNTFDRNEADGLSYSDVGDLRIVNDIFTGNAGYGVRKKQAGGLTVLTLDHCDFFANGLGPVSEGLSANNALFLDPLYVDGPGGDYRLLPASPAVDAGFDSGLDLNGPGPGLYGGAAPDLGAEESPY